MRLRDVDFLTPLLLASMLVAVAVVAAFTPPAMQRVVTEALIYVVIVVGLYIFCGNSGVTSFGHVSFLVIAAYLSALMTILPKKKHSLLSLPPWLEHLQVPMFWSALLAAGVTGLVALLVGWPLMRLRGVVPSMATFALLMITHVVAQNWKAITGGRQALVGLPLHTTLVSALFCAILAIVAAACYQQTRHGALLRCARENETAAESIGIDIARERLIAWTLSAMVSGLGGVLFGHFLGTLNPNTFYLDTTFITLAMLVVGGFRSLSGAVLGVLAVKAVSELFRSLEDGVSLWGMNFAARAGIQEVALALIMLLILVFRPDGLFGGTEIGPLLTRRSRPGS